MERVFDLKFSQTFQVQFPQRNDIWFSIPADFAMEGWSDEEVNAIAGKAVMLCWSFIPAYFSDETANEMLLLSFSVHPGTIFNIPPI